ncbi:hypothetical protein G6F24_015293 [Rhizopus arrhizus]|nr:hypothetical protein G6F24_015293 [Rhizopus arrhizus]
MATDGALAVGHQLLIDEDADRPGIESATQHGAADAETQTVQVALPADGPGSAQGADHSVLDDLLPGDVGLFLSEVAPGHQKNLMASL